VKVLRATQSPLNPRRWCLDLECGHEVWVTSKRKPVRQESWCPKCFEERIRKGGDPR